MIFKEYSCSIDHLADELFILVNNADPRTGYNALWIITHISKRKDGCLESKKMQLVDYLLREPHTGKRRLILSILDTLDWSKSDSRPDYLDFCLSRINSTEPYGIRALCIKQAFALCRHYPELLKEFITVIDMMEPILSPGLISARNNIMKKIKRRGVWS